MKKHEKNMKNSFVSAKHRLLLHVVSFMITMICPQSIHLKPV